MKFLLFLFISPLTLLAQKNDPLPKDIAGVWKGYMYNDTTQQRNDFELAISESNKKLSGYTYTIFLIDGKKNIGIKSVKIKTKKESLLIEDDKLIDNNYDDPPAKGVRTYIELQYSENDTAEILAGLWKTNITREYNSVTGNIYVERKKLPEETAIIPKLRQLNLLNQLSFLPSSGSSSARNTLAGKPSEDVNRNSGQQKTGSEKEKDISGIVKNENQPKEIERIIPDTTINNPEITVFMFPKNDLPAKENEKSGENKKVVATATKSSEVRQDTPESLSTRKGSETKKQETPAREMVNKDAKQTVVAEAVTAKNNMTSGTEKSQKVNSSDVTKKNETIEENQVSAGKNDAVKNVSTEAELIAKFKSTTGAEKLQNVESSISDRKNETAALNNPADKKNTDENVLKNNKTTEKTATEINEKGILANEIKATAKTPTSKLITKEMLSAREIETIHTVEIARDTLIFSLFDNGVIDGDTVSVLLNGEVIMSKIGLLARAYNDTVYLTPEMGDSIHIILYAENLGSIPPNTGLLVVREGNINHEIRFSGDLKKNSAIILKRKKQNNGSN